MYVATKGGFQKGGEHFAAKGVAAAKEQVLESIRAGMSLQAAMVKAGKKPDTARIWMMRDPAFARSLEEARDDAEKKSFTSLGVEKESIPFKDFSKLFLDQTVFPHHQDWIDLLEGQRAFVAPPRNEVRARTAEPPIGECSS
jgi:hypothetical protein